MLQLSFDFPFEDNYNAADFLVTKSNQAAFDFIINYNPHNFEPAKIFGIIGPESSGKTYLSHIWQKNTQASFLNLNELEKDNLSERIQAGNFYIIEDIDKISGQKILLHIYNLVLEKQAHLLLTSSINPANIPFTVADLASRIKNVFYLQIKEPDEELLKMLLIKNFATKQLKVAENVIDYLSKNIERSFPAVNKITKLLEFYCFEEKRDITIPLASRALKNISSE